MSDLLDDLAAAITHLQNTFQKHGLDAPKSIRLTSFEQGMRLSTSVRRSRYVFQGAIDLKTLNREVRIRGCSIYWPSQPDGRDFRDEPHGAD